MELEWSDYRTLRGNCYELKPKTLARNPRKHCTFCGHWTELSQTDILYNRVHERVWWQIMRTLHHTHFPHTDARDGNQTKAWLRAGLQSSPMSNTYHIKSLPDLHHKAWKWTSAFNCNVFNIHKELFKLKTLLTHRKVRKYSCSGRLYEKLVHICLFYHRTLEIT